MPHDSEEMKMENYIFLLQPVPNWQNQNPQEMGTPFCVSQEELFSRKNMCNRIANTVLQREAVREPGVQPRPESQQHWNTSKCQRTISRLV